MIVRSENEWLGLFKKQKQSGISAAQFCRDESLCARYFSKRKQQLGWSTKSPIKRVNKKKPKNDFIKVSVSKASQCLSLEYGELKLSWNQLPPSQWLGDFIKTL